MHTEKTLNRIYLNTFHLVKIDCNYCLLLFLGLPSEFGHCHKMLLTHSDDDGKCHQCIYTDSDRI